MNKGLENTVFKLEEFATKATSNEAYMCAIQTIKNIFVLFGVTGKAEYHLAHEHRSIEALKHVGEVTKKTHPHLYSNRISAGQKENREYRKSHSRKQ